MKKILLNASLMMLLFLVGGGNAWADEWSIDFSEIGSRNSLTDKYGASISAAVANGMGTVTLGEALNSNFGLQTGTSWLYRTGSKGLYSANGGGRNFGVFNAIANQLISVVTDGGTINPTNATLMSTDGNTRVYKVTADGTVIFNIERYKTIYSISVANPSATDKNYTVKYVDAAGNELKESSTKSGAPNSSITVNDADKVSIVVDGQKYIYVSDDAADKTIAEDESTVVTITFREAASYTVNAMYDGRVISTANAFEGDNAYVTVPYYQFVAGTLYGTPAVDKGSLSYGQITVGNATADVDVNVTYTEDANQNAVFYSEAEEIATLTAYSDQYTQGRMSNGAVGYAEADGTVIATLPAGKYTLTSSSRAGVTNFFAGAVNVLALESTGAVVVTTGAEFTLLKPTDITVNAGSKTAYFDYVLIRKTGEADAAVVEALAALKAAIDEANELSATLEEGDAKSKLDEEIDVAQGVYDNSEDAEELETATTALKKAIKAAQSATAIKSVSVAKTNVVKFIENGQVKIVKNGKTVSVSGIAE